MYLLLSYKVWELKGVSVSENVQVPGLFIDMFEAEMPAVTRRCRWMEFIFCSVS
jgi:hypothetical protein